MEEALEEERSNFQRTAKKLEKAESQLKEAQRELHELQATVDKLLTNWRENSILCCVKSRFSVQERQCQTV